MSAKSSTSRQLPLPILPRDALVEIVLPAWRLLPPALSSVLAQVFVLTCMLQEAGKNGAIAYRWQVVDPARPEKMGPARGIAQFELGGGVKGVIGHPSSRYWAAQACKSLGVDFNARAVWLALSESDALAAVFARLLAFTDPKPLPALGDWQAAFAYYLRNWRPGAWANGSAKTRVELKQRFERNYAVALAAATQ